MESKLWRAMIANDLDGHGKEKNKDKFVLHGIENIFMYKYGVKDIKIHKFMVLYISQSTHYSQTFNCIKTTKY